VVSELLKSESKNEKKGPVTIKRTGRSTFRVNPFSIPKDASIYWQGWVKYFHYNNGTQYHRPLAFYKNLEFFAQRIPRNKANNRDKIGSLRIPTKFQFFLVLYNNSLSIYNSRSKIVNTAYDTLHIDYINMVPEDQPLKGGIKDLGDFNEGKCIEVNASIPYIQSAKFKPDDFKGRTQTWIICTDKSIDKQKFLMMLLKLKIRRQREFGQVTTWDDIKSRRNAMSNTINGVMRIVKSKPLKRGSPKDGYWMLLQDWTECSLKCGGGTSWQHWMCVPPKQGGKPCKGSAIRTRPCNTRKCPGVTSLIKLVNGTRSEVKKPIIKVAPFSLRPQRYSKCLIKDNDAFLSSYNPETRTKTKLPVRVVMNNQTFTIFGDDSYTNVIYSFKLEYTNIIRDSKFCCFKIIDSHKQYSICGYDAYCGDRLNNQWVNQWRKDFDLFRLVCRQGRAKALLSQEDEHELEQNLHGKINIAKEELIALKQELMEKKEKRYEQRIMRGKVLKTQNDGFTLLQREVDMENMIKKEEKEKEGVDIKNVLKVLKAEKRKKKCLRKTLKKREKENQKLLEERENQNEIKKINREVSIEVELKRNELKRQVALMRLRARRKKAEVQEQVTRVRGQMAKELMEANKNGDIQFCRKGKFDILYRKDYCDSNFRDDFIKNTDCKDNETFCYLCCENEFGNSFLDRRDECYNMCDGRKYKDPSRLKKKAKPGMKKTRGGWVWVKNLPHKK